MTTTVTGQVKKLLNDPDDAVDEMLEAVLAAHPSLLVSGGPRVVSRAHPRPAGTVGVAVGGGSGHEPAFLGYVGPGLADSAALGNVFASPPPDVILDSVRAADHGAGVLLVYGNYMGDVLNCRLAARRAEAEGIEVRSLFVTDDVASAPLDEIEKRRGIAGDVVVFKVAGAAAEAGLGLDDVERLARLANDRTRSMGVALAGVELPGAARPVFESPPGVMEVGLGVHGEPGVRQAPLGSADEVGAMLAEAVAEDLPLSAGDRVSLLVNGLGATTGIEQYLVYRAASAELARRGVTVVRSYVGEYVTSLQMAGVSVTVTVLDDDLLALLDAPAQGLGVALMTTDPQLVDAVRRAATALIAASDELCALDSVAGDGDHGLAMATAARHVLETLDAAEPETPEALARLVSAQLASVGGSMGALLFVATDEVANASETVAALAPAPRVAAVLGTMERAIGDFGGAKPGDKTVLDAIDPARAAAESLADTSTLAEALARSASAARSGADATADMVAKLGRASRLGDLSKGSADAGATSFAIALGAVADAYATQGTGGASL